LAWKRSRAFESSDLEEGVRLLHTAARGIWEPRTKGGVTELLWRKSLWDESEVLVQPTNDYLPYGRRKIPVQQL